MKNSKDKVYYRDEQFYSLYEEYDEHVIILI